MKSNTTTTPYTLEDYLKEFLKVENFARAFWENHDSLKVADVLSRYFQEGMRHCTGYPNEPEKHVESARTCYAKVYDILGKWGKEFLMKQTYPHRNLEDCRWKRWLEQLHKAPTPGYMAWLWVEAQRIIAVPMVHKVSAEPVTPQKSPTEIEAEAKAAKEKATKEAAKKQRRELKKAKAAAKLARHEELRKLAPAKGTGGEITAKGTSRKSLQKQRRREKQANHK